jgi:hypothetical protein
MNTNLLEMSGDNGYYVENGWRALRHPRSLFAVALQICEALASKASGHRLRPGQSRRMVTEPGKVTSRRGSEPTCDLLLPS